MPKKWMGRKKVKLGELAPSFGELLLPGFVQWFYPLPI